MKNLTEAIREITQTEGVKDKITNSDIVRKLTGKISKGQHAARMGNASIKTTITHIDTIKNADLEKKEIDEFLAKLKKELIKNAQIIRKLEGQMK